MYWKDISHQESSPVFSVFMSEIGRNNTHTKTNRQTKNPTIKQKTTCIMKYCLMSMGFGHLKGFQNLHTFPELFG